MQTGTASKSGTGPSSSSVSSPNGLRLTVSANATEITVGQKLNVSLSIVNTLPEVNTLKPSNDWLLHGVPVALWPPCYFGLPAEAAVLQGNYDSQDIKSAANVAFSYTCMEGVNVDHVIFQPNSDQANLTGLYDVTGTNESLGPFHMSLDFTTGGYWNLQNLSRELNIPILGEPYLPRPPAYIPFAPGVYTIAVADEWGQVGIVHVTVVPASPESVVLAAGTTLNVSSSYDCVAGHYEVPFVAQGHSVLSGGFNAGTPGVTVYVATAQQASTVFQGHPSTWVYSTGLRRSANFTVPLDSGSYVVWIEGADENCGATIGTPLEQLTVMNVTQAFTVRDALATTTPNSLCTTPVQPSNASGTADVYVLAPGSVGVICVGYQFRSSGTYSFSTPDFGPLNGSGFQACGPFGSFNGAALAPCEHLGVTALPAVLNHSGSQHITVAYAIRTDSSAGGLY